MTGSAAGTCDNPRSAAPPGPPQKQFYFWLSGLILPKFAAKTIIWGASHRPGELL
jgi:hypothetical protein